MYSEIPRRDGEPSCRSPAPEAQRNPHRTSGAVSRQFRESWAFTAGVWAGA